MLNKVFKISERGSNIRREVTGGATTYMTMIYIVFVQPVVLSSAGMDFGAVMVATCVASAVACLIMGIYANYPVALAPAMGTNFYFAFTVIVGMKIDWPEVLGATFVAGILFLALSLTGLREKVISSLPSSLMNAMASGIGLMIALVGLEWSGIIVDHAGTLVGLGDLGSAPVLLSLFGLGVISVLLVLNVPGAILVGIFCTAAAGMLTGLFVYQGIMSEPPSLSPTAFKLELGSLLSWNLVVATLVFLFLDIFDTLGTLVGIAPEAGLMKQGHLVNGRRALVADATGTVVGSLLGTSTITCYVESAAGIQSGARTGLASVVTGMMLFLTPFFYPMIKMIGGGVQVNQSLTLYPVTAPALIIIGVFMMKAAAKIPWFDFAEALPAFLTMTIMPLTVSITEGISFGLISYSALAIIRGKAREASWPLHLCAVFFLLRYIFLV